ncbi:TetR/AcrR family transcriptional regulator [Candidatus Uabimicrobium amorphum]|uniref:TetR family transcriptional regulator n=1 Tax=Uabimicrobium amorphum TaxID=2596890 RepID=A0A5S9F359_UABAM|nr:TetR/AcrR family transcriptional regulator [Candidatus Uabimicrobium amorphum]BBM83074.1 TetR family transcriptional regulator [Candidatus Uabimicrobium amorphum]
MARPIIKKDIIIRAALEVFTEKGVDGTTIQDIASRANAAGGTLYRYFRSKEELAQNIFFENLDIFVSQLDSILTDEKCIQKRLRIMVDTFYEFFENDQVLFSYLLLSEHNFAKRMKCDQRTPIDVIIKVIDDGKANKEIPEQESSVSAAFIYGAVVRVTFFKIYGRIQNDIRIYKERIVAGCWNFLQMK